MSKLEQKGTLYRRYRPQEFKAVRGQAAIVESLQQSVASKKIAHAYLFSGGRGTGKTTVARILAKSLGVAEQDLYEMDAASNRGIDDIRELREGVYAMPFASPYKFYIIDEAHMLTKEAWNALLKTLEEPPAHAIFVLATTEIEKVPDTIQSRCEIYTFAQPGKELLEASVTDVAKSEGYTLEKPAAELMALLAEGSFRDALSILQKILSGASGKKITLEMVESSAGAPRAELVRAITVGISEADAASALAAIDETRRANMDPRLLTKLIIQRLRVVLLLRFAPALADQLLSELTEADQTLMRELSKKPSVTSETLRTLLAAYGQMAYAALPYLPLELAVVDLCGAPREAA